MQWRVYILYWEENNGQKVPANTKVPMAYISEPYDFMPNSETAQNELRKCGIEDKRIDCAGKCLILPIIPIMSIRYFPEIKKSQVYEPDVKAAIRHTLKKQRKEERRRQRLAKMPAIAMSVNSFCH